jgi:hypothetical protein
MFCTAAQEKVRKKTMLLPGSSDEEEIILA